MSNSSSKGNVEIWTTEITVVFAIDILFIAVGLFLHLLGIGLIITIEWKRFVTRTHLSNQNVLLLHLSLVSILSLFTNAVAVSHKALRILFPHYFIMVYFIAYIAYLINLFYLSMDRLLFVIFPMRYRVFLSKTILFIAIILCWAISVGYAIMMKYAKFINHGNFSRFSPFVYNGLLVFVTIVIYIAIIWKVNKSAKKFTTSPMNKDKKCSRMKSMRKYMVPFLIVFTFFLFNIIPSIITSETKVSRAVLLALIGLNIFNHVTDPMIYIFIQPSIRKRLYMLVKKSAWRSQPETSKSSSGDPNNPDKKNKPMKLVDMMSPD